MQQSPLKAPSSVKDKPFLKSRQQLDAGNTTSNYGVRLNITRQLRLTNNCGLKAAAQLRLVKVPVCTPPPKRYEQTNAKQTDDVQRKHGPSYGGVQSLKRKPRERNSMSSRKAGMVRKSDKPSTSTVDCPGASRSIEPNSLTIDSLGASGAGTSIDPIVI
ncbi:hypothetical protein HGRIS_008522 [Hohenbuehelia grisea]|uniref:Uncharacterized protein n=1 Tax=Hohenbuehelia grisea TaxID=104357 RepID=A0ABR3J8E9_9AGAR